MFCHVHLEIIARKVPNRTREREAAASGEATGSRRALAQVCFQPNANISRAERAREDYKERIDATQV